MINLTKSGTLASRYMALVSDRDGWLELARRNAALTLPGLIPQGEGSRSDEARHRPVPHNNLGAQGVNTLAAKMVLQLLPPNQPFFRLEVKPEARKQIDEALNTGDPESQGIAQQISGELESNLVDIESQIVREVGRGNSRSASHEAFKHLLVAGNVVLHVPEEGPSSVIDLRNFVVERDPSGTLLILVIREQVAPIVLDAEVRAAVGLTAADEVTGASDDPLLKPVEVYTAQRRISKTKFEVFQEINDIEVPGSRRVYEEYEVPFIVLRGTESPGESYGDAYVSDYEGDLIVLEGLSKAIKEAAVASSMLIFGIDPSAKPGLETLVTQAKNGAAIRMRQTDVFALQVNKLADLSLSAQTAMAAEQRLRQAFLMNSTRDAERVTAEEIRQNFAELQQALGGTFALLDDNFQRPMLHRSMRRLKKRGGLAGLENALNEIEPILITGVDAIGRNSELNNMLAFVSVLREGLGEDGPMVLHKDEFATRAANATSVKAAGLVKSRQELQDEMQQGQNMALAGTPAAAQVAKAVAAPQNPQGA